MDGVCGKRTGQKWVIFVLIKAAQGFAVRRTCLYAAAGNPRRTPSRVKRAISGWTLIRLFTNKFYSSYHKAMDFTRYYVLSWAIVGFDEGARRFNSTKPLKNVQFCSRARKAKILTTGIHGVFRGLKFEPDAGIGQKGAFFKGFSTMLVFEWGQDWKSFWQLILYIVIKSCYDFMKLPQARLRDLINERFTRLRRRHRRPGFTRLRRAKIPTPIWIHHVLGFT